MSAQPSFFKITMGQLPENYCPGNPQELADAIASRLMITTESGSSSFVTGSVAPTSNQGPWLKDGLEWWVWDDSIGGYRPITKGGFNTVQSFDASGTFTVPAGIYYIMAEVWGGGGGGGDVNTNNGNGGGGGGFGKKLFPVLPGDALTITVGAGGANGSPAGANGGDSLIILNGNTLITAGGGVGGQDGGTPNGGGAGGAVTGASIAISGGAGDDEISRPGGNGGSSPCGGAGGTTESHKNGIAPGGGGSGGQAGAGGVGASGRINIWY